MADPRWPTLLELDTANRKAVNSREIKLWGNSKSLGRSLERFVHLKTELKSKIARCIYHTLEIVGQRLSVSNAGAGKRDEPKKKIKMAAEWGEGENGGGGWRTKKTKEIIAQKHKRAPMKLSTSAM